MRWLVIGMAGIVCASGCARKSSLLLERQARGPMSEEPTVAQPAAWRVEPVMQEQDKAGIHVLVNHASQEYLRNFFTNRALFQQWAGKSPFAPEHLVFYLKIENRSAQKIRIDPASFVLLDDLGNQYSTVGVDYVTALADYRRPTATTTRTVLEGASPGYFGISLPIGRLFLKKPQGQFALLQQTALQPGYLFPSVMYDGLIAFWNPAIKATRLRLVVGDVTTDFNAEGLPKTDQDFVFEFQAVRQ